MYNPIPTSIIQVVGSIICIEKNQVVKPLTIKPIAIKICATKKAVKLFLINTRLATSTNTINVTGISVWVNTAALLPKPSSIQISAAKLSLISRKMVSNTYKKMRMKIPGKNCLIKFFRSILFSGFRSLLTAISLVVGGGIFSSKKTNNSNGKIKIRPVAKGSQNSVTCHCSCTNFATDFTKPDENIKLTASTAPIKSVAFLPSI